jgi:DNA primase
MADSPVELIKEKIDIVDFISSYINLSRAGKNWKGLCPFHKEKTPSFMVSPERQTWHCFGCNLGGDIFTFLMKYENLEFGEALRVLAEKAGVELKKVSPQEYKYIGLLYELNELAKKFFISELENNKKAFEYILSRGLKPETISEFEIGFAPDLNDGLSIHLINSGYFTDDIIRAGLAIKNEKGRIFDRFRGRIMFPIHNHLGKVVGFTGRILPEFEKEDVGKYINSPETPIFKKSKILYGFWKSKNFIREKNSAFLVEGQMDFLASWQAGIKNTVASSGTALTEDHLSALRKLTDKLIITFDNDKAGQEAGEKAIDMALKFDFDVKIVIFQDFKDPAEVALAGEKNLLNAIEKAMPAPEFYFQKYLKQEKSNWSKDKLKNIQAVLQKLLNIESPVERNFWIKKLSEITSIDEKVLIEEAQKLIKKVKIVSRVDSKENNNQIYSKKFNRWELLSQEFIIALLGKESLNPEIEEKKYLEPNYQKIFELLSKGVKKSEDPSLDEIINLIMLKSGDYLILNLEEIKKELKKEYLKEKKIELTKKIREAEKQNNEDAIKKYLAELNDLLNQK